MTTYDTLQVDIGNAPDDDQGDPLRTAFDKINQRFAELRVFLNNRGDWAPNTAYTADPNRDWVIVGGVGYLATSNHTSGATFAADLAAGKWVEADALLAIQEAQAASDAVDELRADLASTAASKGASLVAFKQLGAGAADRAALDKMRESVSVFDFMTAAEIADVKAGTAALDVTAAIQAAINSLVLFGGVVHLPMGRYKVTAPILMKTGVSIVGDGYWNSHATTREGVTSIYAEHTGAAMLSLKGAIGCTVSNLSLEGSQTAKPKTGILLGRATLASAGFHTIRKVAVCGWYTVAAIYSIASEDNLWEDIITWNFGGDALYGLYTSTKDTLSVDGLVTSTNLTNTFVQAKFIVTHPSASSAGICLDGATEMGSWNFFGCYVTQYAGAYVKINNGSVDGTAMFGPITFVGVSGEPLAGGDPLVGIDITAPVPVNLQGLTITGARFQLFAGANHFDIRQSSNVTLMQPNIVMQPPESFPYATSDIKYDKVRGGFVSVGRVYQWTDITLNSGWTNTFGAPYAAAGYRISPTGQVSLRGTISGGTGTAFTLPVGYRPPHNMFFPVFTNAQVLGRVLVNTAGDVAVQAGNMTNIDLTTIKFDVS